MQGTKSPPVLTGGAGEEQGEGMGIGWGGGTKESKKKREIKDKIFVSSTLKWTPLVYTFTFI